MIKPKYKKPIIVIASSAVVIILLSVLANNFIENKITTAIDELPESVKVKYTEVDVSVWSGDVTLLAPIITVTGETTQKIILDAKLKALEISDLGYWDLIFNDKISVDAVLLDELVAKYKHNPIVKNDDYQNSFIDKLEQAIHAEKIAITKADLLITDYETDAIVLSVPNLNFELLDLKISPKVSKLKQKFSYNNFKLNAKNLKWATNQYDDLIVDSISVTKNNATFNNFKLQTKYSKAEYSTILKTERDHFNLDVKSITISDMDFGFNNEDVFYFKSKKVDLNSPTAEIYRDKLVADDLTYKPLYGTSLRNLDFNLGLDMMVITDGSISYLEKVNIEEQAGRLDFTNLNASFAKLGNTFGNEDTAIQIETTFMNDSPLKVDWNFKVADTTDQFTFKADLGYFNATQMDQFTKPNLKVDLNGDLKQTYFTISGNPIQSRVDIKMKYDDFEVAILKKDGEEKNKFLSSIVNLFVSKDSDDDKKNYRYGQSENLERTPNKSVFNFIWLNVRSALLSAMAGDGEEKKD